MALHACNEGRGERMELPGLAACMHACAARGGPAHLSENRGWAIQLPTLLLESIEAKGERRTLRAIANCFVQSISIVPSFEEEEEAEES